MRMLIGPVFTFLGFFGNFCVCGKKGKGGADSDAMIGHQ